MSRLHKTDFSGFLEDDDTPMTNGEGTDSAVKRVVKGWAVYSAKYDDKIIDAHTSIEDAKHSARMRVSLKWRVIPCEIRYTLPNPKKSNPKPKLAHKPNY